MSLQGILHFHIDVIAGGLLLVVGIHTGGREGGRPQALTAACRDQPWAPSRFSGRDWVLKECRAETNHSGCNPFSLLPTRPQLSPGKEEMGLGSLKPVTGGHKLLHRPSCPAVFLRWTTSLYMAVSWTSQVQSFIHPSLQGGCFLGALHKQSKTSPHLWTRTERGEKNCRAKSSAPTTDMDPEAGGASGQCSGFRLWVGLT